jgi:drug/metabolite transporter (DMT)-like permease
MTERRRAAAVMVVLVVVWGYSWILSKIGLRYCGPLDFATLRTVLGAAALLPALLWLRKPLRPQHPWHAVAVGVIQTAAFLLLNSWALSLGEPGKTAFLVFTMPFWVLIFAWPILGERIDGLGWLAVALAAAGLILLLEPWSMRAALFANALGVGAGICWALGAVIAKKLHNHAPVDPFNFTFWQMVFGAGPMILMAATVQSQPIYWNSEFVLVLITLSVVATAGGWMMWIYVLHRLPAGTTSMASLGVPVIALLASAAQLGERPRVAELGGIAAMVLALAIVSWDTVRTRRTLDPAMGQE